MIFSDGIPVPVGSFYWLLQVLSGDINVRHRGHHHYCTSSFFHNFFKVAIRNAIPDIKENSIKNDIFWEVSAFEAEHMIYLLLKLRIMIADNVGKVDLCDRTVITPCMINKAFFRRTLTFTFSSKSSERISNLIDTELAHKNKGHYN
ncbi:hypothetical protein BJAS_P4564 [Bathymodiolus japonicus methanotrophic gill symbiont]|nr:hypothetical protein BJAS_P4564 [Bathymodiolus japonicus methanotrophic gill symbiont]